MTRKIREAVTHLRAERPLEDEITRDFLQKQGFDLKAPISWFDNAGQTLRTFRQDESPLTFLGGISKLRKSATY